jgi:hypothetical protein
MGRVFARVQREGALYNPRHRLITFATAGVIAWRQQQHLSGL